MSKRQAALLTGWSLILMAILAGFSFGYAYPEFYQSDKLNSIKDNLLGRKGLYLNMLIGILLILILDLVVSYTLYCYFKKYNKKVALVAAALRYFYTVVFGIATYSLTINLSTIELNRQMVADNFKLFQLTWSAGLIIFGVHIILLGILMKFHSSIPKFVWYLTVIAGVSYITVHVLKLAYADAAFVSTLEMVLALPMAIGELGLAIWLLVKGGKKVKPAAINV